jgi:serine/threonine-protein kinase RsbW
MGDVQEPTASSLPLWWYRRFPGESLQISSARSWLAGLLPACGPLDDLLLFASELATNALVHTRSGEPDGWFSVEVTWCPMWARVVVGDQGSDEVPTRTGPRDDAIELEDGRGLALIDALSAAWGAAGGPDGRWLWADVDWRSRRGPLPMAASDNSAAQQFADLHQAYPETVAWYSSDSRQWHATLPLAVGTGSPLCAPSPAALAHLVAARYPAAATRH